LSEAVFAAGLRMHSQNPSGGWTNGKTGSTKQSIQGGEVNERTRIQKGKSLWGNTFSKGHINRGVVV